MQEGIGEVRIRIPRIISKGEIIRVQALIKHPMETGLREDKKTKEVIPAHYIHDISIYYGETMITHCDWTIAISADPLITFYLKADRSAPLKIIWKDNKGGVYQETVQINPQ